MVEGAGGVREGVHCMQSRLTTRANGLMNQEGPMYLWKELLKTSARRNVAAKVADLAADTAAPAHRQ
jgi:hypothetical protein